MRPPLSVALVAVLAGALVAGCSASTPEPSTDLGRALSRIADTPTTSAYVEYGDVAALRANPALRTASGYGWGDLASRDDQLSALLGLDTTKVTTAVAVGRPPDGAGFLQGSFDSGSIETKLRALQIRSEQSGDLTHWTLGADHTVNISGPLQDLAAIPALDDIATKSGVFAYSSTASGLQTVTNAGDTTLAANATISALTGCLGDVRLALLMTSGNAAPLAAGLRTNPSTDVLCVLAPDGAKAGQWRNAAETALRTGKSGTGASWSSLLSQGAADVTGDGGKVVRVTGQPTGAVDVFPQAVRRNDIATLVPIPG